MSWNGIYAQQAARVLRTRLDQLSCTEVGPLTNAPQQFSFVVNSRDGSELLVTVQQTKAPPPRKTIRKFDAAAAAAKCTAETQRKCFEAQERRRKHFLGEL
jgi:hypothetical protein